MKMEYNGYRLVSVTGIAYHLLDSDGAFCAILSNEQVEAIHILSGHILKCSDENCPCHEAGRVAGRDAEREPFLRQL